MNVLKMLIFHGGVPCMPAALLFKNACAADCSTVRKHAYAISSDFEAINMMIFR